MSVSISPDPFPQQQVEVIIKPASQNCSMTWVCITTLLSHQFPRIFTFSQFTTPRSPNPVSLVLSPCHNLSLVVKMVGKLSGPTTLGEFVCVLWNLLCTYKTNLFSCWSVFGQFNSHTPDSEPNWIEASFFSSPTLPTFAKLLWVNRNNITSTTCTLCSFEAPPHCLF